MKRGLSAILVGVLVLSSSVIAYLDIQNACLIILPLMFLSKSLIIGGVFEFRHFIVK